MARPFKTGLDYFPFDVDFFNDDKIELISSEFGAKGEVIAIRLLCQIYRNGYYYQWGKDESLLFAKRVGNGVTGALVDEVVAGLVKRSFFDERVFNQFKILTSRGIQRRYLEAKERAKEVDFIQEYLLIDPKEYENRVNVHIYPVNVNNNPQSKVKKTKEENNGGEPPAELVLFQKFKDWQKKNSPRVLDMKEPFTLEQYLEIKTKYTPEKLKEILVDMHNYKPLLTKNISAYLTLLNWAKRRQENPLKPVEPEKPKGSFNPALNNRIAS